MEKDKHRKPRVGITLGDPNGIGPEVVMKTLMDNRLNSICTPVIYGSGKVFSRYRKMLGIGEFNPVVFQNQLNEKRANLINCFGDSFEVEAGKPTPESGLAALACLKKSVEDLKSGFLDAVVTAPISKHNIQSQEFKFAGHTEFFTSEFAAHQSLMMLCAEDLKVALVTGHIPLSQVSNQLTSQLLEAKLDTLIKSLLEDFGISKPKIAVLGLNPHAGESGLLGKEEIEVITPVIERFKAKGHLVFGPFPADGFFGNRLHSQYDAILAMFHDQGLIPFKYIGFETGVNFTAGLPIVRTSPDHGTAFSIAGKGVADESSFRHALFTAIDITKTRREKITSQLRVELTMGRYGHKIKEIQQEDETLPQNEEF
jgi:4-hydroxythreonine-4-phosphate dehydrogenase